VNGEIRIQGGKMLIAKETVCSACGKTYVWWAEAEKNIPDAHEKCKECRGESGVSGGQENA
jgi:hypothetical protein